MGAQQNRRMLRNLLHTDPGEARDLLSDANSVTAVLAKRSDQIAALVARRPRSLAP